MLNGTKEDVQVLKSRMEERRLRAKLGKVTGPARPAPGRSPAPLRVCSDRGGCASLEGPGRTSLCRARRFPLPAQPLRQGGGDVCAGRDSQQQRPYRGAARTVPVKL